MDIFLITDDDAGLLAPVLSMYLSVCWLLRDRRRNRYRQQALPRHHDLPSGREKYSKGCLFFWLGVIIKDYIYIY